MSTDYFWNINSARCLKITDKSLIQHCERSEIRLHFKWTKVNSKCKKWSILASFWKPDAYGQTVLPDMSVLIGQKLSRGQKLALLSTVLLYKDYCTWFYMYRSDYWKCLKICFFGYWIIVHVFISHCAWQNIDHNRSKPQSHFLLGSIAQLGYRKKWLWF